MRRKLYSKSHQLWRITVIDRDKECVICGRTNMLNVHHLIPHEFKEFEFEKTNGICLCPKHHTLGKFSAHKNPLWFSRWLEMNRPKAYERSINRIKELERENLDDFEA